MTDIKLPTVLALDDDTGIATRAANPGQFEQAARHLDETDDRPELAAELRRLAAIALKRPVVTCDHAHPDLADMRATLAACRAVLDLDPATAHEAAGSGSCDACTVVAAVSFGFSLAASAAGEMTGLSEPLRARLAAAITETERELLSAPN